MSSRLLGDTMPQSTEASAFGKAYSQGKLMAAGWKPLIWLLSLSVIRVQLAVNWSRITRMPSRERPYDRRNSPYSEKFLPTVARISGFSPIRASV